MCSHWNRLIVTIIMSTHNIPFSIQKRKFSKLSQICSYGIFSKGLNNEFEIAVENEPSVFEPSIEDLLYMDILLHFIPFIWDGTLTGMNLLSIREQILSVKVPFPALVANCSQGDFISFKDLKSVKHGYVSLRTVFDIGVTCICESVHLIS